MSSPTEQSDVRRRDGLTEPSASRVLDQVADSVVITDAAWRVRYMNEAARELCHLNARTACPVHARDLLPLVTDDGTYLFDAQGLVGLDVGKSEHAVALMTSDGHARPVLLRIRTLADGGMALTLRDRSGEQGWLQSLNYEQSHDALTGLANRQAFVRQLSSLLAMGPRTPSCPGALIYLDLDQFRVVNDTCGHDVGDAVLRVVAKALVEDTRADTLVARLGGDEFGGLIPVCTREEACDLAARWQDRIDDAAAAAQTARSAHTASVGIVMLDAVDRSPQRALSAADLACAAAKDRGRDRVEVYGDRSSVAAHEQIEWVGRVRRACDEHRFELFRQPIVPLQQDAERPHYELLLRMVDRTGQCVMPAAFIPAAERFNAMGAVDRWTLRRVLSELVWRPGEGEPYLVSVNLSGTSLRDSRFRRDVIDLITRHDLEPDTLCFEVTETAAVGQLAPVRRFMERARESGCRFSLDDFGTGMASFAYLQDLPVDYLKVDGRFVRRLLADSASFTMVRAFHEIAKSLGIQTVGERVEDAQTARALREMGIDFAQGYFFERPRRLRDREGFRAHWRHVATSLLDD
ncbi:MAG: EAL domain-containing protein [Pseudomonadota bacterium]